MQDQQAIRLSLHRIKFSRRIFLCLPWIGLIWQGFLAQSNDDWSSALLASIGSFVIFYDSFRPERIYRYPLSTLVMMGFAVTLQLGPLLFTALEGSLITYNLKLPVETFFHGFIVSFVVILSHACYRNSLVLAQSRLAVTSIFDRYGLFRPLRIREVIVMGSIGVFSLGATTLFGGIFADQSVLSKFVQGFQFLSVLPACLLLNKLTGSDAPHSSRESTKRLIIFFLSLLLILVVSVGRNSRGTFVTPVACLLLGLSFQWLLGLIYIRRTVFVAFLLSIVLLLPLFSDLATSMVMVRGLRSDISSADLFKETLIQLKDREAIKDFRFEASQLMLTADWSENYVSNLFLARFSNAKFPDNSLLNASLMDTKASSELANFQWWRTISLLPGPMLSLIGIPLNIKEEVGNASIGDMQYYLASGSKYALGGFRTGHFFGSGMSMFGYFYLLVLGLSLLIIYPLVDSHARVPNQTTFVQPSFSAVAITQLIAWFTFSNAESVVDLFAFSTRPYIEPLILFVLLRRLMPL